MEQKNYISWNNWVKGSTLKDIKGKVDKGLVLNLKEGSWEYTFRPQDVEYNSDGYFVFRGTINSKSSLYDLYIKDKGSKKCFIQDPKDGVTLNIDTVLV